MPASELALQTTPIESHGLAAAVPFTKSANKALIGRATDFWLIGGASIFVWAALYVVSFKRGNWAVDHHIANLPLLAASLALVVNYPHFMVSYKIAYSRGWRFILSHWFHLLFVPLGLLATFFVAYIGYTDANPLPPALNPLGLRAGEGLMYLMIGLMYLTVGWHYIKQTFGCMMVYGSFDGYKISLFQRRVLLTLLYSLAVFNFLGAHVGEQRQSNFYGIITWSIGLPQEVSLVAAILFWVLLVFFGYSVLWRNWRATGRWPSLHFVVPLLAILVWWLPIFYQADFYFQLVPLFHSLQYLPFAYRYEEGRNAALSKPSWAGSFQVLALIAAGYLAFELLPYMTEDAMKTPAMPKVLFFVAAAHLFINIHHYFIDNVIWKFHQPEIQKYLFGRNEAVAT